MKQSGCTIFIQISLCLIVYVSLHLSHQSLSSSNDGDNAGALDLHFISFSGGFRPLHRQTRLLQLVGLANLTVTDCGGDDPELKQEMEKQFVDLETEELKLQEAVADEHSRHMNVTLAEAKRVASHYQKEAEKCNAATEICESAKERAEALLIKERKITAF
ncbi:Uncharacterized protein Rs2_08025 [Raphanus sativus]|nr:Uncharacterized protein Rs2_08025 [Raphanus sativus]